MRQLAHPWAIGLFTLVLARLYYVWSQHRSGAGAFRFSSWSMVKGTRGWRVTLSSLPLLLELIGLSLLVIALTRPQEVTVLSSERFGIDLVIALDGSGSMAAEDFHPGNRFTAARQLISQFIDGRDDDRVGLVTFGARASTRVPVTFDRDAVRRTLARTELGENGDGTAIGHAIATSVNRLRNSASRSKVIILLTDGVNNAGSIEPATAAALAQHFGIKIYTIGVGSRGVTFAPMKFQDPITGEIRTESVPIRADLDEALLRDIARATGGEYFRAVDSATLGAIFDRIDHLEKSRLSAPKREEIRELYARPLFWAIVLLALSFLLGESVWIRLPA